MVGAYALQSIDLGSITRSNHTKFCSGLSKKRDNVKEKQTSTLAVFLGKHFMRIFIWQTGGGA